ncbi:ABC-type sugar transport system periplasmic component [Beutenbergia cavernae DSM 12333]|uniref:ABC-type sugar transport system periplasmic component n=1 Tax=Beutenbergia cavernae (strain ATCC BAA-8 / DSM 12333 / CCUG 43141 / JCM 11478 / NBRC 16432 / NCIMB 13614 / HKI 0122) TaxID=471853 RepID=C5C371_BEUC1|nr:extracellular solute-binding protein [Beutenbergia cavernae]ACQ79770.1 ABC-type sugar transport system periplasmic component [Beutenbergia cavernae DSM 12333]
MRSRQLSRRAFLSTSAAATALGGAALLSGCGATAGGGSRVGLTTFAANVGIDPRTGREIRGLNDFLSDAGLDGVVAVDVPGRDANSTNSKVQTMLLGGSVDIIQMSTVYPFFRQGLLADLTPYYERDSWADNYIEAIFAPPLERIMYPPWDPAPSTYISSPGILNTLSLAYDAQLFEDFGVEPPGTIPDIDDVVAKLPRLTGTNPRTGEQCYGMYYDPRAASHIMLYYFGRGIDLGTVDPDDPARLAFDTDQVRSGIEQMIATAEFAPPGFEIGQGAENWGTENNTVAINMSVAPAAMQTAQDNGLVDRFVVTEGVRNTEGHTFYVTATEFAIASAARDTDLAWEAVKLLSGAEGQRFLYEEYQELPTWRDADWVDTDLTPYAPAFIAAAEAGRNAFFPEFMFRTFRPWMASIISRALGGASYDLAAELADQQRKAEQWVLDQA